jgi:dTDP-4-dehydrorhamnose reductase
VGKRPIRRLSRRAARAGGILTQDMTDILVTGGTGQIGGSVVRMAIKSGFRVHAPSRLSLDLGQPSSIVDSLKNSAYRAVINCAAYTAVDRAEGDIETAVRINAEGPAILARETDRLGIPLIHVSTDYVFDGSKASPYLEHDLVNPIGVYGRTKEAGEAAVRSGNPKHAIIRTAWVVSAGPANFLDTMFRLAADRDEVGVVNDQRGCPSAAEDIASALLHVTANLGDRAGTWHFVNDGEATWHDLASHIFSRMARNGWRVPKLNAISTSQYPTVAKRPVNSRLDTSAFRRDFAMKPRPWRDAVDAIIHQRFV